MLIPKFSIRHLLLGLVAVGLLSACVAGAMRGSEAAKGLAVAIFGLVIPVSFYAIVYGLGWAFSFVQTPRIDRFFLGDAVVQPNGGMNKVSESKVDGVGIGIDSPESNDVSDCDVSDCDEPESGGTL